MANNNPLSQITPKFVIGGIVFALLAATLVGAVTLYFATKVFMDWQEIPKEYFRFTFLFDYYEQYGHIDKIKKTLIVAFILAGGLPVIVFFLFLAGILMGNKRGLHGDARFANDAEVKQSGFVVSAKQEQLMRKKQGDKFKPSILLGSYKNNLLQMFGSEFAMLAAPTRSGKGVGVVVPNLLHYQDSVVVVDVKYENWELTSGFRSQFQDCYLFAPNDINGKSHRYNPLGYVRNDDRFRVSDISNIANILYPTEHVKDDFWPRQAQTVFLGVALYLLETPELPCNLTQLLMLTTPKTGEPFHEWIPEEINRRVDAKNPLSVECQSALMDFVGQTDNTRSSILASFVAPLGVFRDPITAAATWDNDFDLREIRKKRTSIYVAITPSDLTRYDILLRLFFSQLINLNTQELPENNPELKHQVLLMMDEFTALGHLPIISKAVGYIAGYGLRLLLIFQDLSQAESTYTREGAKTLMANMKAKICYAPNVPETAKQYVEFLGTFTDKGESKGRSRNKGGSGTSTNISDQRRDLMNTRELMELPMDKEFIILNNEKPILCDKIIYYTDPVFSKRARLLTPDVPTLKIQEVLNKIRNIKIVDVLEDEAETIPLADIANMEAIQLDIAKLIGIDSVSEALGFDPLTIMNQVLPTT